MQIYNEKILHNITAMGATLIIVIFIFMTRCIRRLTTQLKIELYSQCLLWVPITESNVHFCKARLVKVELVNPSTFHVSSNPFSSESLWSSWPNCWLHQGNHHHPGYTVSASVPYADFSDSRLKSLLVIFVTLWHTNLPALSWRWTKWDIYSFIYCLWMTESIDQHQIFFISRIINIFPLISIVYTIASGSKTEKFI